MRHRCNPPSGFLATWGDTSDLIAFYHPATPEEHLAIEQIAQAQREMARCHEAENKIWANPEEFFNRIEWLMEYQVRTADAYDRAVENLTRLQGLRKKLPNEPIAEAKPPKTQPLAEDKTKPNNEPNPPAPVRQRRLR